jgi:hypothetical protein
MATTRESPFTLARDARDRELVAAVQHAGSVAKAAAELGLSAGRVRQRIERHLRVYYHRQVPPRWVDAGAAREQAASAYLLARDRWRAAQWARLKQGLSITDPVEWRP